MSFPLDSRYAKSKLLLIGFSILIAIIISACRPTADEMPLETAGTPFETIPATSMSTLETPTVSIDITEQPPQIEQTATFPTCQPKANPSPSMTEGPYYKSNTPERTSLLEPGTPGDRLVLTGHVLTTDCVPIAGAWLDFWQADGEGRYDNAGYKLRGHQFTDREGQYYLETVLPGVYPGRTRHIHVKVKAPGQPVLTTQLFFPDEPANLTDAIYDPALLVFFQKTNGEYQASFDFILDLR